MANVFWTSELAETLRALWQAGSTGGQIAKIIGKTRNQVLGKLHRMGLTGFRKPGDRPDAIEHRLVARRKPSARSKRFKAVYTPPPAGAAGLSFNGDCGPIYDIMQLRLHTCRWPVGDPQHEDFCYCGAWTDKGPYCHTHKQIAYQEPLWRIR